MKKLVLLRPGHEALQLNIEEVSSIVASHWEEVLEINLNSGEKYLGYLVKFE